MGGFFYDFFYAVLKDKEQWVFIHGNWYLISVVFMSRVYQNARKKVLLVGFFYLEKEPEGRCETLTHHMKIVAHNGFATGLAAPAWTMQ